jgi:hypothetical protein
MSVHIRSTRRHIQEDGILQHDQLFCKTVFLSKGRTQTARENRSLRRMFEPEVEATGGWRMRVASEFVLFKCYCRDPIKMDDM